MFNCFSSLSRYARIYLCGLFICPFDAYSIKLFWSLDWLSDRPLPLCVFIGRRNSQVNDGVRYCAMSEGATLR